MSMTHLRRKPARRVCAAAAALLALAGCGGVSTASLPAASSSTPPPDGCSETVKYEPYYAPDGAAFDTPAELIAASREQMTQELDSAPGERSTYRADPAESDAVAAAKVRTVSSLRFGQAVGGLSELWTWEQDGATIGQATLLRRTEEPRGWVMTEFSYRLPWASC